MKKKSSRKIMLNRNKSRKHTPSYLAVLTKTGGIDIQPVNRKALRLEISKLRRSDGTTTRQHEKEKRKQRLTKARRILRKIQDESRRINRGV